MVLVPGSNQTYFTATGPGGIIIWQHNVLLIDTSRSRGLGRDIKLGILRFGITASNFENCRHRLGPLRVGIALHSGSNPDARYIT